MTININEINFDDAFEFNLFIEKVESKQKENPEWRNGQTYFNVLVEVNPLVAEKIRKTKLDPFFRDEVSKMTNEFVLMNWSKK